MPRGGRREGQPGKAYPQRRDLSAPKPPAGINRPAPGQQYGKGAAQAEQMKAVPLAAPAGPQPPPQAPDLMGQAMEGWQPLPGDPSVTQRPDEPITAGLDSGPGPGSEVLPTMLAQPPDLQHLFRWLPALERMASTPGSSPATRSLFRQIYTAYLSQQ